MNHNLQPCPMCVLELNLLRERGFDPDVIRMYEDRYGLLGRGVRSWLEIADVYGCDPEEACYAVDEVRSWLDEHSPYRLRRQIPQEEPHQSLAV